MHDIKLWIKHKTIVTTCIPYKEYETILTLNSERATLFLHKTHHCDTMNICAKLFQNPFMHDKNMSRTLKYPTHILRSDSEKGLSASLLIYI